MNLPLRDNYTEKIEKNQVSALIEKSKLLERARQKINIYVVNSSTGEIFRKKFEFRRYYYDLFTFYKQKTLEFVRVTQVKEVKYYFITFTAPSKFHYFKISRKTNKIVRNNKCFFGFEESIEAAGQFLYNAFRTFYKRLKDRIGYRSLDYIRFFEFHKSLTPHLHFVIAVPSGVDDKVVYDTYWRVIRDFSMHKKSNKIEKLNDAKHVINYVTKYITKTLNEIDEKQNDFVYFIDGWKRVLKKRLFFTSRFLFINQNYVKKIYREFRELIKDIKGYNVIEKVKNFLIKEGCSLIERKIKRTKTYYTFKVKTEVFTGVLKIEAKRLDYLLRKLSAIRKSTPEFIKFKLIERRESLVIGGENLLDIDFTFFERSRTRDRIIKIIRWFTEPIDNINKKKNILAKFFPYIELELIKEKEITLVTRRLEGLLMGEDIYEFTPYYIDFEYNFGSFEVEKIISKPITYIERSRMNTLLLILTFRKMLVNLSEMYKNNRTYYKKDIIYFLSFILTTCHFDKKIDEIFSGAGLGLSFFTR